MSRAAQAAEALRRRKSPQAFPGASGDIASDRDILSTGPLEGPRVPPPELPMPQPHEVAAAQQALEGQPRPGSIPAQVSQAMLGAAPVAAKPLPQVDDEADIEAAREADRESRFAAGMELAGRQLVGGITRTPVPQGLGANPSEVPLAMARAKSKREQAAEALMRQRQGRLDAENADDRKLTHTERAAAALRAEQQRAAAEKESRNRFDLTLEQQRKASEAQLALARANLGIRQGEVATKADNDINDDVQKLGAALPGDVADFDAKYKRIQSIIARNPGDIPGVGRWDAIKPSELASDDDMDVQKDAGQLLAAYQKLITGAGASDAERKNLERISVDLKSEKGFARGLESLKAAYDAKVKDVRARFRPEVVKRLEQGQKREGLGGNVEVVDKKGTKYSVPAAEVEALRAELRAEGLL